VSPEEGLTVNLSYIFLADNSTQVPSISGVSFATSKTKENYPQIQRKLAEIESQKSNGLLRKG